MEFKQIKSVKTNFVKKHIVYDIQLDKNHFFSANNIIYAVLMGIAVSITSQVGYDKVKEAIQKFIL